MPLAFSWGCIQSWSWSAIQWMIVIILFKAQHLVPRDYSKHAHSDYTKLTRLKTGSKRQGDSAWTEAWNRKHGRSTILGNEWVQRGVLLERKGKVIPCWWTENRNGAGTNSGESGARIHWHLLWQHTCIHVSHTQTHMWHIHSTCNNKHQTQNKIIQNSITFKMRTFPEVLFHLENGWSSPMLVSNHKSWYRWIFSGYIVGISNLQSGKTPTLVFAKSENTMLISFKIGSIFYMWKWYSYTVWTSDLRFLLGLLPQDENFLDENNFPHFQPSCNITDSIQSPRKWKDQWQLIMVQSFEVLT